MSRPPSRPGSAVLRVVRRLPSAARLRRFAAGLAGLALLPAAGLAPGCARHESGPPHLVLVTVDTLRPDHMSVYGYARPTTPGLARWFPPERSARFDRAYSSEASTTPSVVSFLSGLLPQEHRVRLLHQLLPDETRIVPDLLPPAYESAAFVSNTVLTDEASGLGARFDHYDDFVDEMEPGRFVFERNAARTTDGSVSEWNSTPALRSSAMA